MHRTTEMIESKLRFEDAPRNFSKRNKDMPGEPETILRRPRTVDKTQTAIENQTPTAPGDDAPESKRLSLAGSEPEDNSRILQLASIAQYRAKRRMAMAEKTRQCEQLEPAFSARKS